VASGRATLIEFFAAAAGVGIVAADLVAANDRLLHWKRMAGGSIAFPEALTS
jgi:hypothetical protein